VKKVLALAAVLFVGAGLAYANYCAKDYVPASTLLVPYVVVDAQPNGDPDPAGYTTLLTVTNVSRTRQIIHVTVWNALSEAVVDFSEILSGYDVWSINFRDLLNVQFNLFDTFTSNVGFHGTTTPTPLGPPVDPYGPTRNRTNSSFSDWPALLGSQDIGRADGPPMGPGSGTWVANRACPPHAPKLVGLEATYKAIIRDGITDPLHVWNQYGSTGLGCLSGVVPTDNGSWLKSLGSYPYFFYVTVDVVRDCTDRFPSDENYWTGNLPTANNVLIGQIFYLNFNRNFSESLPAVSIEGDLDTNESNLPQFINFYEGISRDQTGTPLDFHEPLGSAYAINFFTQGGVSTDLIVWKEFEDTLPTPTYPPNSVSGCWGYTYYAWDEDEHFKSLTPGGGTISPPPGSPGEPNIFPFETQKVPVTLANFNGLLNSNGWMLIVFDNTNLVNNAAYTWAAQAYVAAKYTFGTYSTAIEAALMANTHCFANQVLNVFNTYYGAADGSVVSF
jgi:hypothetical protein